MGCYVLLQGIFLTQESNPHLLYLLLWQAGSLPAEPLEKPLIPTVFSIMTTRMVIIEKTDNNRQKEKGTTEDEMAGWHHRLDGCESE